MDLTEEGWDYFKNNDDYPTCWADPASYAAGFKIPEDIHDSWIKEIGHWLYMFRKMERVSYESYVTGHFGLSGIGLEYQRQNVTRAMTGFDRTREAISAHKIDERLNRISRERHEKLHPKPRGILVGDEVRLPLNEHKAKVAKLDVKIGQAGWFAELDSEIGGSRFWPVGELQLVRLPLP